MIIGIISPGSGCGDQLFSYIATRVRAADLGVDFGFVGKEYFKGQGWMDLDFGKDTETISRGLEQDSGKVFIINEHKLFELNKPYYDPNFNFIPDGSVIDGYGAQDVRYFEHRLDEVKEWLKINRPPIRVMDSMNKKCIINFRGGEYTSVPELFLPQQYWDLAVGIMISKYPDMKFEVHTDDEITASKFFPRFPIIRDIEANWRALRMAKHSIISNSAFAIIPSLLSSSNDIIAPKFWAGRNVGEWRRPGNYYRQFQYI